MISIARSCCSCTATQWLAGRAVALHRVARPRCVLCGMIQLAAVWPIARSFAAPVHFRLASTRESAHQREREREREQEQERARSIRAGRCARSSVC